MPSDIGADQARLHGSENTSSEKTSGKLILGHYTRDQIHNQRAPGKNVRMRGQLPRLPGTFDDQRRPGSVPSVEFHGVPGRDTQPLQFDILIKVFHEVIEYRKGWKVRFFTELLSAYISDCQPADRMVLFARIETPLTLGHVIEFEPLRGQSPYTLAVLRRKEPAEATVKEVGGLVRRWLTDHGRSHIQALLEEDEQYQVMLSTHRDWGTHDWAARILDKIKPPDERPSWTRGVAF